MARGADIRLEILDETGAVIAAGDEPTHPAPTPGEPRHPTWKLTTGAGVLVAVVAVAAVVLLLALIHI